MPLLGHHFCLPLTTSRLFYGNCYLQVSAGKRVDYVYREEKQWVRKARRKASTLLNSTSRVGQCCPVLQVGLDLELSVLKSESCRKIRVFLPAFRRVGFLVQQLSSTAAPTTGIFQFSSICLEGNHSEPLSWHWLSIPIYFKNFLAYFLCLQTYLLTSSKKWLRCCQPDAILNQKSRFASPFFREYHIESLHSNSPVECDLCLRLLYICTFT